MESSLDEEGLAAEVLQVTLSPGPMQPEEASPRPTKRTDCDGLEWDYEDLPSAASSGSDWSFNSFMDEYNELYAKLNQLQELAFFSTTGTPASRNTSPRQNASDQGEEDLRSDAAGLDEEHDLSQQIAEHRIRYELFVERNKQMAAVYPYLSEDVLCRVELLNAKWEILQMNAITKPVVSRGQSPKKRFILSDIQSNIGLLDQWLTELEDRILPLQFKLRWSEQAMNQKKSEVKIIQDEISAHGKVLKAILKSCQKQLEDGGGESGAHHPAAVTLQRLLSQIEALEHRWHQIGLRALEWQYFLEGLEWTSSDPRRGSKRLSDKGKPSPRRFKHHLSKRAKSFAAGEQFQSSDEASASSSDTAGPRSKWPRIDHEAKPEAELSNPAEKHTWPAPQKKMSTSKASRKSSSSSSSMDRKNLSLPLMLNTTDSQKPNCAAYFFEHGRKRHSLDLDSCYDHDSGLENQTPDRPVAAGRQMADVHEEEDDGPMDIKELVTRADELVTDRVLTQFTFLPADSRDASGEDCSSLHDDMSCDDELGEEADDVSADDSLTSTSSSSSAFSHDMTLTVSSATSVSALDKSDLGASMLMTTSTSSSNGTTGGKVRRRVRTRKSSSHLLHRKSGDFNFHLDKETAAVLQSTPVKKKSSSLVMKSDSDSELESSMATSKTLQLASPKATVNTPHSTPSSVRRQLNTDISEAELSEYWDQEKYLSEHNYEEPIDEASALRLLNFGDDYRNYLDSLSDGCFSSVSNNNNNAPHSSIAVAGPAPETRRIKRRYKKYKSVTDDGCESLSDSEVNHINEIISKLSNQLEEMSTELKSITRKIYTEDVSDYLGKVLQISEENSNVLKVITEPLNSREYDAIALKKTARGIKGLQKNWEDLGAFSLELLNLAQTFKGLQASIQGKERAISEIVDQTLANQSDVDDDVDDDHGDADGAKSKRRDYAKYAEELKAAIVNLTAYKSDLFNINLGVHNLLAAFQALNSKYHRQDEQHEHAEDPEQQQHRAGDADKISNRIDGLKDAVVKLYAMWDEAFHRVNSKLVETEMLEAKVRMLEEEAKALIHSLQTLRSRRSQRRRNGRKASSGNSQFEDSGISESSSGFCTDSEIAETEQIVQKLQSLTDTLRRTPLPETSTILDIVQEGLIEGGKELGLMKRKCEAETQTPSLEDKWFEDGLAVAADQEPRDPSKAKTATPEKKGHKKRSRLWRVFRIALGVHFLLVVLAGLSWAMEPTCCDRAHTYSIYSLIPTLTFNNGPPPI